MKIHHYIFLHVILCSITATAADSESVEGFTEPYRTIHVASAESGIVEQVFVEDGARVSARQPLAALDAEVHRTLLEIAKQQMEATGRLNSATAEMELHASRLAKLSELRRVGQAYQQEVDRARADVEVAEGRLLAIREDLALKRLEYKKIELQLRRRTIIAPVDGVIVAVTKNPGEYVSPVDAEVMTLVQLNPLRATFMTSRLHADKLRLGEVVNVTFTDEALTAIGIVENVSEVTDAESGTVPVKIRIDNREGKYRSGERCMLQVDQGPTAPLSYLPKP